MERGLLWLPLLIFFSGLAWAGWNEYQKVEAYRIWAQQFERAKYDIRAVLGQKGTQLTWGQPTRQGPTGLETFSLTQVRSVNLQLNHQRVDLETLPNSARSIDLVFDFWEADTCLQIPFTEVPLAASWAQHLQQCLKTLKSEKN